MGTDGTRLGNTTGPRVKVRQARHQAHHEAHPNTARNAPWSQSVPVSVATSGNMRSDWITDGVLCKIDTRRCLFAYCQNGAGTRYSAGEQVSRCSNDRWQEMVLRKRPVTWDDKIGCLWVDYLINFISNIHDI